MTKFSKGDTVAAKRNLGEVPKGSKGIVTEGGWGNRAKVLFEVKGFFGDKKVEKGVDDSDLF